MEILDTNAVDQALNRWYRDRWEPLERDFVQAATAMGESLSIDLSPWQAELLAGLLGPDMDRYRVAMALPRLQLRQLLTQGLVPYTAEA